jgi:hypothetical protein
MSRERLRLSYAVDERISESLDNALCRNAFGEGFEYEPYATGFNFLTGERDLVFEART